MIVVIRVSLFIPRFTTDYYTNYMYLLVSQKKKIYMYLLKNIYLALLVDITSFFNNDSNLLFGKKKSKS